MRKAFCLFLAVAMILCLGACNFHNPDDLTFIYPEDYNTNTTVPTDPEDPDPLQETADKITALQSPSTLTISIMSDVHYSASTAYSAEKLQTAMEMGRLGELCQIDLIANLGDMVDGDDPANQTLQDLTALVDATNKNAKAPVLYSRGNHDDNGWYSDQKNEDDIINDVEWYEQVFGFSAKDLVTDETRPAGGYGYYDHTASKIRVFVLNSADLPYILEENGTYRYSAYYGHAFSNEQINFVANSLQFEDKEDPSQWAALFLIHVPMDTSNNDGYRFGIKDALIRGNEYMLAVINAYQKGSSFAASGSGYNASLGDAAEDFNVSVNVDYSANGTGNVIGFINGHTHTDNFSRSVGHEVSLSRGYNYLGVMGSLNFSTLVIDRENNKISVVKYGVSVPDETGAVADVPDEGTIQSGQWSVHILPNLPTGENLYNGLSDSWTGSGYTFSSSTGVDPDTLEPTELSSISGDGVVLRAIRVKPFTRYAIPSDFRGQILTFVATGQRSMFLTPNSAVDYQWIQTDIRTAYIVIIADSDTYPNYENFQIREIYAGLQWDA